MSTTKRRSAFLAILGVAVATTPGCTGFISVSALKTAVEAMVEDRDAEDIGEDLSLRTAIIGKIFERMGDGLISINVDVYEQDVMLTGAVENHVDAGGIRIPRVPPAASEPSTIRSS